MEVGYPFRCPWCRLSPCHTRASTSRGRMPSCGLGFLMTKRARTTSTGCAGPTGSSARTAADDRPGLMAKIAVTRGNEMDSPLMESMTLSNENMVELVRHERGRRSYVGAS